MFRLVQGLFSSMSLERKCLLFFGSASSAFHLSRNYPLFAIGGKSMGYKHGQFLKFGSGNENHQSSAGISSDAGWRGKMDWKEEPLGDLYLTMLHRFGIEAESFAGSTRTLSQV
ncbi:MAG: hypothetical protein AAF585_29335 [Verrucomicrobiota bacterium]